MVRLNRNFAGIALLTAALMFGARQAKAQATAPQAPPASAPAASGGPLHWSTQGNKVQPVTPAQAQGTVSSTPQAVPPAAPDRMQGAVPNSAQGTAPGPHAAVTPARPTATTPARASTSPHRKSARLKKTAAAEVPPTPAPPPTLAQLPPTPPQVRFQNGELTIDAQNSTLAQVLRAVQAKTGASIDIPGSAGSDRVATLIGPGQPQEVLNKLLNGSRFDYVILGVAGDPGAVQKVILTPRQAGSTATAQNNPTPQAQPEEPDEGSVAESEPEYQNQYPQQPVRPGGFRHPGLPIQPPFQQNGAAPEQEQEQEQNNGAKTPEQLMQELQQMQQQQQQLQEQLNPANRQPPQ